ncbi:hypothetical protein BDZ97DRAFT_1771553 [Flammula alnicola]|nr:hypothetical protein BDZ97DRAFT_1771553 [Flammula alnicola]
MEAAAAAAIVLLLLGHHDDDEVAAAAARLPLLGYHTDDGKEGRRRQRPSAAAESASSYLHPLLFPSLPAPLFLSLYPLMPRRLLARSPRYTEDAAGGGKDPAPPPSPKGSTPLPSHQGQRQANNDAAGMNDEGEGWETRGSEGTNPLPWAGVSSTPLPNAEGVPIIPSIVTTLGNVIQMNKNPSIPSSSKFWIKITPLESRLSVDH